MELEITRFSAKIAESLFYKPTEIRKIATGFRFTEGPVWDPRAECLYFTDFRDYAIYRWTEGGGAALYRKDSGRAIGLALYPYAVYAKPGRLVAAESASRAITFAGRERSRIITDNYLGKKLNSPNDLVVTKNGDICFTDPFSTELDRVREIDFNGVYRVTPCLSGGSAEEAMDAPAIAAALAVDGALAGEDAPAVDGALAVEEASTVEDTPAAAGTRLLYAGMPRPNGLAFSPDESVFYVNDTNEQHILAFDVHSDGTVSRRGVFAATDPSYGPGAPDGMKVDALGNIYVTGPGGIWVFAPDASPVALLHTPELAANFCFGGPGMESLYITASSSVYKIIVKSGGIQP